MPTTAELSDAPKYAIKTVCAQTGILPVTLRAWERRYKLLQPRRTSGNYRLYSDRDIALLRWIKSRVEGGMTISRVVDEFHAMRRAGQWPEAAPVPPSAPLVESATPPDVYARRLYAALVGMNEAQAAEVMREAHALFDLSMICLSIIQPCLYEIGEAWYRGKVRIATEHFASQYLRGRLLTLFQAYPMRHSAPRVVVGCAPNEFHDIGSLMVALLLRREGYRVEFVGADVHLEDLSEYARAERPALICLSANSEAAARGLRQMDARLAGMRPRPKFAFGGRIFNLKPQLRTIVPGLFLGEDAGQAVVRTRDFLPL
jgi:MerR family transcriptional regulator, light-induced transcriptional regulator